MIVHDLWYVFEHEGSIFELDPVLNCIPVCTPARVNCSLRGHSGAWDALDREVRREIENSGTAP